MAVTTSLDQDQRQTQEMHASGTWRKSKNNFLPCRNLLFLHAITRCDTTSLLYGVGKATALSQIWEFENVLNFKEQANIFSYHLAVSDVVPTGEKALVSLFGRKLEVGLNNIRYQCYFGKTCKQDVSYRPAESAPNSSCCSISQPACLPTGKAVAWRRCWHVDGKLVVESH